MYSKLSLTNQQNISFEVLTNEIRCSLCNIVFKTKNAYRNHTINSGCDGKTELLCFCLKELSDHKECPYLKPCTCSFCHLKFKTLEGGINHCNNAHHDGSWMEFSKFLMLSNGFPANPQYSSLPFAQSNTDHWNYSQMLSWWNTGDSKTHRYLSRKVLSTPYHDPSIIDILAIRKKIICWEKKPNKHNFVSVFVQFGDKQLFVELDRNQRDYLKILNQIHLKIIPTPTSKIFPNWKQFLPEAQGLFDFTVNHTIDIPILEKLTSFSKTNFTGDNLKLALKLITKLGICYSSNWNQNVISLTLFDFFLECNIPVESVAEIIKLLFSALPLLLSVYFAPKAQSSDDLPISKEIFTAVATVISVFAGSLLLKSCPKSSTIDDFVLSATKLGNFSRAMDNSWKGIGKLVEFLYDLAFEFFTGFPKDISEAQKYIDGITLWFTECTSLASNDVLEQIQTDAVLCRKIEKLYLEGITIQTRSVHLKLDQNMRRAIDTCQRNISALNDRVSKSGAFRSGPKVEPLIIQLFGNTSVGKSGLMYLISGDIIKTEDFLCGGSGIATEDWANQIYPRNVEQEFFDGYRNQLIVLYDDFGQLRDSQAKPNPEFMEMIRFGNLAPMCLHMASLEQKDKTFFSSKCVILSSNCREYPIESLISKAAFQRRIDLSIEIVAKPEFCLPNSTKIDTEKVHKLFNSPIVPEIYTCRIWQDDKPSPIWIDYNVLRKVICQTYGKKMNRHFELTSVLSDYMKVPLDVDITKIRAEIAAKVKIVPTQHYTLDELQTPFTQSNDEEVFVDTREPECVPFPDRFKVTALTNRNAWRFRKPKFSVVEESSYFDFMADSSASWNVKFVPFSEAILNSLETANGQFTEIMGFLSIHGEFLTLKTQLAFIDPNVTRNLCDPEFCADYFSNSQNFVCKTKNCWHPDVQNDNFGFQPGCEKELLSFLRSHAGLCHRYPNFYEDFLQFEIIESTVCNRFHSILSSAFTKFTAYAVSWMDSFTKFISDNATFFVISGVILFYISIIGTACSFMWSDLSTQTLDEKNRYADARNTYEIAREQYKLALKKLNEAEIEMNLSHKHEDLELGKRIKHAHACEQCGLTFFHTHEIKTEEISVKFKHLCPLCKKKPSSELQSGDSVTTHAVRPVVEFQSGDSVTTHALRPVVQLDSDKFKEFVNGVMLESNVEDEEFVQELVSKNIHQKTSQLAVDANAMSIGKKVFINTYQISSRPSPFEPWKSHVNCVFIRGRTAITVGHLESLLKIRSSGELKIDGPFKPEGYIFPISSLKYKVLKYKDGREKDLMILIFPNIVHDHQDITHSIIDSEGISKFRNVSSMLVTPTVVKDRAIFNQRFADAVSVDNEMVYLDKHHIEGKRILRQHYQYIMHTSNGDCGSLLICLSNYLPKKIIGMHVAGDAAGKGYAVPLNISDIEEALKDIPLEAQISLDLSIYERAGEISNTPKGDFSPAFKSTLKIVSPSKTALRKSLIYGDVLEPITAPAKLSRRVLLEDNTIHDPVLAGLQKSGKIPPYIDPKLIEIACNDFLSVLQTNDTSRKRVLTNLEALSGVEDDFYSNPLNRSSSPGFPWIQKRVGRGKTKWTSDPQGEYLMNEELSRCINDREELALQNTRFPTIWIDTLKDERRPLAKVLVGKTRVFAAGPMDFIICARKYFLGFCAHVAANRIDNEIAVGINPYSFDWTHLAKHLQKHGPNVVAGDFGNFDGTLLLQIIDQIGLMINDWYDDGPKNRQIRSILWKELSNSIHIEEDNLYFWTHGHPSGHPLTAILNSVYNSVVCRIVFIMCAREANLTMTMKDFRSNVSMISYGDDNVLNISPNVISFFNQNTMSEMFSKIGMEYTDELKNSSVLTVPFRFLDDISFLKRKFRYDSDRKCYTAPLEYGVCMEMINWIRGELDPVEACIVNCQTSAMELSLHGQDIFEQSVSLIKRATIKKLQTQPQILTYYEYVEIFETSYGMSAPQENLD